MFRLAFTNPLDTDGDGLFDDREPNTGRRVRLRTDPTQDTVDRYGRLLAYASTFTGTPLQERQLEAGWAMTYVYNHHPFQRAKAYKRAQKRANKAHRGVYGMCSGDFHSGQ
jgi:endonuclease YncB( thermonuclease family)